MVGLFFVSFFFPKILHCKRMLCMAVYTIFNIHYGLFNNFNSSFLNNKSPSNCCERYFNYNTIKQCVLHVNKHFNQWIDVHVHELLFFNDTFIGPWTLAKEQPSPRQGGMCHLSITVAYTVNLPFLMVKSILVTCFNYVTS